MKLIQAIRKMFSHHTPSNGVEFDLDYDKAHADKRLNESIDHFCDTVDAALSCVRAQPQRYRNGNGH